MNLTSFFEGSQYFNSDGTKIGFDIETYSPRGFPHDMKDPIVNFSLAIPFEDLRNGLLVASSIGAAYSEHKLLLIFRSLLISLMNSGVLTTYNGRMFDVRYVIEREKRQNIDFDKIFSSISHMDLYDIKRSKVSLKRHNQKNVEKAIGINRVIKDVCGVYYHSFLDEFLEKKNLKPLFYNIEDSVGCLKNS